MSDTIDSATQGKTTGTGSVTVTVDDNKNKTYLPDIVIPDSNKQVKITIVSAGPNKTWTFKDDAISIHHNDHNFTKSLSTDKTVLTITDSEQDAAKHLNHHYTCHVKSNTGDSLDFDPIIKDHV